MHISTNSIFSKEAGGKETKPDAMIVTAKASGWG